MKLIPILFLLLSVGSFLVHAGTCGGPYEWSAEFLTEYSLSEIPRTVMFDEKKMESAGRIFETPEGVKSYIENSSANDNFPFVLSSKGRLVISPRNTEETVTSQGEFAAHDSLVESLHRVDKDDFVIAAGQVNRRNSEISILSNKAGTRRGGSETLRLIQHYFETTGVFNPERAELRDYSKHEYASNHKEDEEIAQKFALIKSDEELSFWSQRIEKVFKKIYKIIPDKTKAGYVDVLFIEALMGRINSKEHRDLSQALTKIYFYVDLLNKEGIYSYSKLSEMRDVSSSLNRFRSLLLDLKDLELHLRDIPANEKTKEDIINRFLKTVLL